MEELITLIKKMDIKGILFTPTTNGTVQFFRYIFVGGMATIMDWGCLFLLTEQAKLPYLISAVFAFIAGLVVNFILSKALVFQVEKVKVSKTVEFINYGLIGLVGLGITEILMYLCTEKIHMHYMLSKVLATIIVLFWNYLARKKILYRTGGRPLKV